MSCSAFTFQSATCTAVQSGFDYSKSLTYVDNDGVAINLTGFIISGEIKTALGGTTLLTLIEVGDDQSTGFYIPDRTNGVIFFQIKAADSSVTTGSVPYEFLITDPSTDVEIFMQGAIEFKDRGF